MFKKKRGIRLPYDKQGLVYFTCTNLSAQPESVQQRVNYLCSTIAGPNAPALLAVLTDSYKSILSISLEYGISEKKLCKLRKEFYEQWFR